MHFAALTRGLSLLFILHAVQQCTAAATADSANLLQPGGLRDLPEEGIPKMTTKRFQVTFLKDLAAHMNTAALDYLNEFLLDLSAQAENEKHTPELRLALESTQLEAKVIFIKQFLDMKNPEHDTLKNFYALRNAVFLRKLDKQFKEMQEVSGHDIRAVRDYHLCRQFEEERKNLSSMPQPQTSQLAASATSAANNTTASIKLDIQAFTRALYNNTNIYGSEIIDDYLSTIKRLFLEVIAEKPVDQSSEKLNKLIAEIDIILNIEDFYNKRQRLYSYLENNLSADFESFKSSKTAQQDIADIFLKLQKKGFDLFVTFLFSNFEFLERLHEEWSKLLPTLGEFALNMNENSKLLIEVHQSYVEFKFDSENSEKYNNYIDKVKALYEKAREILGDDAHVYELLHNGSQNVGPVTFNMIRERCRL